MQCQISGLNPKSNPYIPLVAILFKPLSWRKKAPKKKGKKSGTKVGVGQAKSSTEVHSPTTSKFQGWSVAGIKQSNNLYDHIVEEQNSEIEIQFKNNFLLYCIAACENKGKKNKNKKNLQYEVCRHKLWEAVDLTDNTCVASYKNNA